MPTIRERQTAACDQGGEIDASDLEAVHRAWQADHEIPAETEESRAMSKDLRSRGFKFVGPTICYAHMQATGMVNDHVVGCFRYAEV